MNPTRLVLALLCFALPQMVQARVELVIYTYQSMVSKWGPGQKLKYAFEKNCKCQVRYVGLDDGVALLNRLILEGKQTQSDVILGLDQFIMGELQEKKLVDRHQLTLPELTIPWDHQSFIPFDYGYFTFIYNRKKLPNPPNSLQELIQNQNLKVIYPDPRTSTPGFGFLLWMQASFKDHSQNYWQKLASHTVTVPKGWPESYALFLKGEADLVLSYHTSPAYHISIENNLDYVALSFPEKHLKQIEVAAISQFSQQKQLARDFLAFLLTKEAQGIFAAGNWMQPVLVGVKLPKGFESIPNFEARQLPIHLLKQRKQMIRSWRNYLSQS